MANGWTLERRHRQAELIRSWRPWERSTGPKTDQGKDASSQNALRHGMRTEAWRRERQDLREYMRMVEERMTALEA